MHHHLESIYKEYVMNKDIAKRSKKLYGIVLKQYVSFLIENGIEYAQTSDVLRYKEQLLDSGFSSNWLHTQIVVIKGFYRYLRTNWSRLNLSDVYTHDIAEQIRNPSPKARIMKRMVTVEQAKQIIVTTKAIRKYIWQYRDYAVFYLMFTTGLRSIEIRRAKRKDYILHNQQWILYVQGKGRQEADEFVKITPGVAEALNDYLNRRKDAYPFLFISHSNRSKSGRLSRTFFPRMFERVLQDCGLEHIHITPHALRHSAATFNLLRGGSLESTRQLLRHASIDSTLIYAHHIDRMSDDSEEQIEQFILKELG